MKKDKAMSDIKVIHIDGRPLRIKNTPEAQQSLEQCRNLLYSLAKKMLAKGNEATDELIQANFPEAKTIGKEYADRKLKRTIEWRGERITLIYDYATKTAWASAQAY